MANAADASFTLSTTVPDGTEDPDAATGSRSICDAATNCVIAGPISGNKIDRKGPTITITSPADGSIVETGDALNADYACADAGSGPASCVGDVADGAALATSTGAHSFLVTATDAVGNVSRKTVNYEARVSNVAPVASPDDYSVIGGATLSIDAPGVLGNDTDADGDPLTPALVTDPAHGTLTLSPDGSFAYTPAENTIGTDTFTYRASDGGEYSNTVTVTITVQAGCEGQRATQIGTSGRDTTLGTGGNDVILTLGGNDVIDSGSGNDVVCGGSGDDRIELGSGNDIARGGSGDDVLSGGSGTDRLYGDGGIDRLFGGGDNDALAGGDGSPDLCDGEGAVDTATASCETTRNL